MKRNFIMLNKGLVKATLLGLSLLTLSIQTATADEMFTLNNSALDAVTGAGPSVDVTVIASGSGNSAGQTSVQASSGSSTFYPLAIAIGSGSAIAVGDDVTTDSSIITQITDPGLFPFHSSVNQTVSVPGVSISFAAGVAIDAL